MNRQTCCSKQAVGKSSLLPHVQQQNEGHPEKQLPSQHGNNVSCLRDDDGMNQLGTAAQAIIFRLRTGHRQFLSHFPALKVPTQTNAFVEQTHKLPTTSYHPTSSAVNSHAGQIFSLADATKPAVWYRSSVEPHSMVTRSAPCRHVSSAYFGQH